MRNSGVSIKTVQRSHLQHVIAERADKDRKKQQSSGTVRAEAREQKS